MARRKGGLFLPLDVNFFDDDAIAEAGEKAGWLFLAMCCKAKALLSDGILSERQIERLGIPGWKPRLARLVAVEKVWPTEDGRYWITGWDKHNDRSDTVKERRAADAERKRQERQSGDVSDRTPNLVRPESVEQVEKSREEDSTVSAFPSQHTGPDCTTCGPCRARQALAGGQ